MDEMPGDDARRITAVQLFLGFTRIGIASVGGALPQAQHQLVEVRRWLTQQEFAELLSLGQLLPGPNIGNLAIMLGARCGGWRGATAAIGGLLVLPFFVVMLLAAFYRAFGDEPWVRPAFHGIAAGAAGLILATGGRLLSVQPRQAWVFVMAGGAFVLIALMRMPLMPVLLALGPISAWCAWRWMPRQ
jgi:chromate transporter